MPKIYWIEIASVILCILIIFFIMALTRKKKKTFFIVTSVILVISVLGIGAQYIFEVPELVDGKEYIVAFQTDGKFENPNVMYHGKDIKKECKIVGDIDVSKVGTYKVKYSIPYLNDNIEEEIEVKVVDTEKPEIKLEGGNETTQSYRASEFAEPGYTATDNYDGDLTNAVTSVKTDLNDSQFKMTYTVKDSSGNEAVEERIVNIIDDIPPEVKINRDSSALVLYVGEKYEEKGATAVDEVNGDVSSTITIEGSVDTSKKGTYQIHYKAKDNLENVGEATLTVTVVEKGDTGGVSIPGVIYLTFDDGPSTSITPKILDVLKEKNVKATFFILNYSDATEYLVKRIVNEGHSIGIHGYSHDYSQIYKSEEIYLENVTKLREKIKASTGVDTILTRFPGGSSNTVSKYNPGIMSRLTKYMVAKGYRYFDWNVGSGDSGDVKTSDGVYNNVIKGLSKKRANVVLMHDFSGNTKTLQALPRIIDYAKSNGYSFDRITSATAMVTHGVNN